MSATDLPDELWRKIIEAGVQIAGFTYKDLCCLSISSRRLHRLSDEDSFWSLLLSSDFPLNTSLSSSSTSSTKSVYRIRFEKDRERRLLAHKRAVFRKESQIAEMSRKIREIETRLREESQRMKAAAADLSNLQRVRQASVAVTVWQPEVVRGRQKQIIEQSAVPAESRLHSLEMEIRLCKQQIAVFNKAYREQMRRLDQLKGELQLMKYHPLQEYKLTSTKEDQCSIKKKKLKTGKL